LINLVPNNGTMKKLILSTLFSAAFFIGNSQTIFINEIDYDNLGTDASEGIEVAGPAGTDLTGYSIEFYNGSTGASYNNVPLSGIIPNQDNNYGTLDFNSGGINNWLQNGAPDGVALIDPSLNVVQFLSYEGSFTATDSYAIGLTSDDILVSDDNVSDGSSQLTGVGTTYTDFTWSFVSLHTKGNVNTGQSFGGVLPPTVSFDVVSVSISEGVGTATVNINIANEDTNPTSADVVLGVSTATSGGVDFTYTSPTTITFPASTSTQQTVVVTIIDDAITETSETIVLELQNVTNSGIVGSNSTHTISITDNDAPVITACSELFFSEYMEGTSFNKALEIYNPTTSVIDLSDYEIRLYGNGSATPTATLNPTGIIVPGDVFVIANAQAQASILLEADATSSVANFNGDDAIDLYKISAGSIVDVIGETGIDPGTEWIVGTGSTLNNVLVRMASVDAGTSVWTGVGDLQWDVYDVADTLFIGSHTNTGCVASIPLTSYPSYSNDSICAGQTVNFYSNSFGGVSPYTVTWDFGDGSPTSNVVNPTHVYNTGGTFQYSVTLTVDDGVTTDDSTFIYTSLDNPTGSFTVLDPFCENDTVAVTGGATGNNISYSYTLATGLAFNSVSSVTGDGDLYAISNGSYDITQYVTDMYGCMDSVTQNLTVNSFESADFPVLTNICEGDIMSLNHTSSIGTWSGTNVTDLTNGVGEFASAGLTPGMYNITYDIIGLCPDSHTESVEVYETPTANYSNTGEPTVAFSDLSSGTIVSYLWDLGDGNTSTLSDPTHIYTANGNYTVCLTVTTANGCTDSICSAVQVSSVGVIENNVNTISIYPNPTTNNQVTIGNEMNESLSVSISNVIGQQVWNGTITKTETINLPELNKGNYFVKITSETGSITKKLMIK